MLSRKKPNPSPYIYPVPEHDADNELKKIYQRTKTGLYVPWMGVVAMAFSHYPNFYNALWTSMEPITVSEQFHNACFELRATAENSAFKLGPQNLIQDLIETGYSKREIEDILATNEIFSSGNMPYILMASLARLLLEGHDWKTTSDIAKKDIFPTPQTRPVLIEYHHADKELKKVYDDIKTVLGLSFLNTDYRALARWPTYLETSWSHLRKVIPQDIYENAVTQTHLKAVNLAFNLPNATQITADDLLKETRKDAPVEEVLSVVRLFQWLLPGLAVNVAYFRQQLL